MGAKTPIDRELESKHLFIAHLAERLESMELGKTPLTPIAYRLYAKRLQEAMAGYPEGQLMTRLSHACPPVLEALAARYFDTHGFLPGPKAQTARVMADEVIRRLRRGSN